MKKLTWTEPVNINEGENVYLLLIMWKNRNNNIVTTVKTTALYWCRLNLFVKYVQTEAIRAQVPILFDATQMGDLVSCVSHLTFDSDYLLGNIHLYSITAYVNSAHARHVF